MNYNTEYVKKEKNYIEHEYSSDTLFTSSNSL